jgi:hypothetical protein
MNRDVNTKSTSSPTPGCARPTYEPPVVIDCGTVAALTLGSGSITGSDSWGLGGAGGGS